MLPVRKDFSRSEERMMENVIAEAADDAALAAEQLNEITDEKGRLSSLWKQRTKEHRKL